MAGRWPFVGRTQELARCLAVLESGTGVLLYGDPGVGKSALARAVLERVAATGSSVGLVTGRAVSSGVPFESLAAVLASGADASDGVLSPADVNARLADALGADQTRTVLMVDDAQLLDVQSAEVVHRAARGGTLVLATVGRGAQRAPIERLWRDGLCERVELGGLTDQELVDAIEALLDGPLEPSTASAFTSRAQGNPLLLRELVNTAIARSALIRDAAAWTLTGAPPLSSGIRELISERLIAMPSEHRAALETIAAGEPLPLGVATSLLGEEVLDQLDVSRLINVRDSLDGAGVSSAHPLYGEVIRAELPRLRLHRLRLQLAQSLEAAPERSPHDLVRAAVWRMEGGQAQSADRLLVAARAARGFSLPIAERLARHAHDMGGSLPATLLLAEILTHTGRGGDAATLTAGLPPDSLTASDRESITYCAAMGNGFATGDSGAGAQLVAAVLAGDPEASQRLRALHSTLLAADAQFAESFVVGRPLVDDIGAPDDVRTLAATGVIAAEYWLGRLDQSVNTADRMAAVAARARQSVPYGASALELVAVCALAESARLDDAKVRALRLQTQGIHDSDMFARVRADYSLGRVALLQGLARTAEHHFRRCLSGLGPFDQFIVRHVGAMIARAAATAGDVEAATAAFDLARAAPRIKPYEPEWDLAQAAVLAVSLRMSEAVDRAVWAGGVAADRQQWSVAVVAYHDAARYGSARQVLTQVREAAAHVDGPLVGCYVDHVKALDGRDAAALEEISRRFEALGTVQLAAEAAAEAALTYARRGLPRHARASGTRSAGLRMQCDAAVFPWLSGTASAVPLTGRERQIATLAAAGRTDAKIAALLGISVRTVQSHLARVYAKLGISSRGQLAGSLDFEPSGAT